MNRIIKSLTNNIKFRHTVCFNTIFSIFLNCLFFVVFCSDCFIAASNMSNPNYVIKNIPKTESLSNVHTVNFSDVIIFYIWRIIWISLPCILIIFCLLSYSIRLSNRHVNRQKWLLYILRWTIGFAMFIEIMTYFGRKDISDIFIDLLTGSYTAYLRIVVAFFLLLFCVLDWKKLWNTLRYLPQRHPLFTKVVIVVIVSFHSFLALELQSGSHVLKIIPYILWYNVIYWLLLQGVFYLLFRNVKPGVFFCMISAWCIGLANDMVYQFRGNYILFGDLTAAQTAFEVAGNYHYQFHWYFWLSLFITLATFSVILLIRFPKRKSLKETSIKKVRFYRVFSTIISEIFLIIAILFSFQNGWLYHNINGLAWNYNNNVSQVGYLTYFLSNLTHQGNINVDGYNIEVVEQSLTQDNDNTQPSVDALSQKPNIIIIQNEALSDLTITQDIKTDKDPLEFIHSLSENTLKGFVNSSIKYGM